MQTLKKTDGGTWVYKFRRRGVRALGERPPVRADQGVPGQRMQPIRSEEPRGKAAFEPSPISSQRGLLVKLK